MATIPAGTPANISIGSGLVLIGDAATTPATDVGYLGDDGITLSHETEIVDVTAGFPAVSVRRFVSSVSVSIQFQSIEWNLANFNRSVNGTLTVLPTQETLDVGIDACPPEVALQVQFCMPCTNDTITINAWRAQTDGALELALNGTGAHTFAYNFQLLLATEDWATNPLTASEGLYQIIRDVA